MTSPFPNLGGGGVVQDPGLGAGLAQGLAGVLAQMQTSKENQFRQQELQNAQAQQQALQQYYEAQAMAEQQRLAAQAGEQAIMREGQRQVGGAQRAALGGQPDTQGIFSQILQGGAQQMPPQSSLPSIFTGVSNENLPAAVQGVQEVNKLTPQPPPGTGDMQDFEYMMRLAQRDPQKAMLFKQWFIDKQPSTVINNIPAKGETKFTEKYGELQADLLNSTVKEGRIANADTPRLQEAYSLADRAFTGVGANAKLNTGRVLSAMGVKQSKNDVENTQTFLRLQREGTLNWLRTRALGSGNAVSNQDREYMDRVTGADITLDRGALKKIIRINFGTNLMKQKEAIDDLRDKAVSYPANAQDFNRQATQMQRQYDQGWQLYTKMKADESMPLNPGQVIDSLFPRR